LSEKLEKTSWLPKREKDHKYPNSQDGIWREKQQTGEKRRTREKKKKGRRLGFYGIDDSLSVVPKESPGHPTRRKNKKTEGRQFEGGKGALGAEEKGV